MFAFFFFMNLWFFFFKMIALLTTLLKALLRMNVCHPILDTRISGLRPSVCHAQGTPLEIWNGLDWRALVKLCPPNIGKLRGKHFFFCEIKKKKKKKKTNEFLISFDIFRDFRIFWPFLTIFGFLGFLWNFWIFFLNFFVFFS